MKGIMRFLKGIPRSRAALFIGHILPNAALFALSALLASFRPFGGAAPFGAACVIGAWFAGVDPYSACAGAVLGHLLSRGYVFAGACFAMGAAVYMAGRVKSLPRPYRILIAYGAEAVSVLILGLILRQRTLFLLASSTVSVFGGIVLGQAVTAFRGTLGGRKPTDAELMTLAAAAGLITLSMGSFRIFGISPAMIFAGLCGIFAACRYGVSALAFAVTAGAGRVMATGGDLYFIAVLSAATLIAASFRALGKWAVMIAFGATSAVFRHFMGSVGVLSHAEWIAVCLIFAAVPLKAYMSNAERRSAVSPNTSDPRLARLQLRTASLSDVLSSLSSELEGNEALLLRCVSDTLKRSLRDAPREDGLFSTEYGMAAGARHGSTACGDSVTVKDLDGKLLLALSDGMGSGVRARDESRRALALLSELMTVGFCMDDAADCVNSLLSRKGTGDMYATLDVILIDLENGTARLKKYGAPSSYVLRGSKLYSLYSEALPLGILETAESRGRSIRLKSGDTLIMMSDGVADALGSGLYGAITDNVLTYGDPELAARSLLSAAKEMGGTDDMTVLVCRVEENVRAA